MRFAYRAIPAGARVLPLPIVDVVVDGLEIAPQACLLDSGASAVRFGEHVAELCGIDLAGAPVQRIGVGGATVGGRGAEVSLELSDGTTSHRWETTAWFCDPWMPAFGLLGTVGFFDRYEVLLSAYDGRIELTPVS